MTNDIHSHKENKKWATATNVGKEVYFITKLFKKKECVWGTKNQKHHHKNPEYKQRLTKTPKIPK
jgi:hypothetical protein